MQLFARFLSLTLFLLAGQALGQVTVTDFLNREVTLAQPASRIVSLMPSHTETLLALGAGGLLVGVDEASTLAPGVDLPRLGNGFQPNIELILSLEPDLVLTDQFTGLHEQLHDLGLVTFAGTPQTVSQVLEFNLVAGRLSGREAAASELTQQQEESIRVTSELTAALEHPSVYVELDPTPFSAGPGSYVDDLLQLAGGVNVVPEELGPWPMLSAEFVLASDPDVVLLLDAPFGETAAAFRSRPGFSGLSGRVVEVDAELGDLLSRPGPGLVESLQRLLSLLHPGVSAE